ncbi:nickel-dependent lactate racemase [Chloroflexota bacterium]|nr:nickel-dependent lactate racemase [Chloroflexota bacterium]
MKEFTLPYNHSQLTVHLPDSYQVDFLLPEPLDTLPDADTVFTKALSTPVGIVQPLQSNPNLKVGIAINDKTRPVSHPHPVTYLLTYLDSLGFVPEQIALFLGSGTHKPMPVEELPLILDEETIAKYTIFAHDCDLSPMAQLGTTHYGTPISINQDYVDCDLKFTVGNIEPHHFMGYSGGVKTAAIGLASRETINVNHAMLTQDLTRSGLYSVNPMRQDIEEIGRKIGIHFALGTILNEDKQVLKAFFGEPRAVMQAAIPTVRKMFTLPVQEPYDLVFASPGGYPKDINLYQAQKGLTHAARITRDNGTVILLAGCEEGSGSPSYETYITQMASHQDVIDQFKDGLFKVGPHKAYQIARDAQRVTVILISEIPPESVREWKLTPSQPDKLDALLEWLTTQLPTDTRVAILPAATRTMTEIQHA